jgi:hypothetical protein
MTLQLRRLTVPPGAMPLVSPWAVRLFERCVGPIPTNPAGDLANFHQPQTALRQGFLTDRVGELPRRKLELVLSGIDVVNWQVATSLLQVQSSLELNPWRGCDKILQKSSKIVSLGEPNPPSADSGQW